MTIRMPELGGGDSARALITIEYRASCMRGTIHPVSYNRAPTPSSFLQIMQNSCVLTSKVDRHEICRII